MGSGFLSLEQWKCLQHWGGVDKGQQNLVGRYLTTVKGYPGFLHSGFLKFSSYIACTTPTPPTC